MAYNQKKQAGRGSMQKTGAGVPSALLQSPDEKKGKNYVPPGGEYVNNTPAPTSSGDKFKDDIVTSMYKKDIERDSIGNANKNQMMEKLNLWPKQGDKFGGGTIKSIDEKGNYNINTGRSSDNIQVSRKNMRYTKLKGNSGGDNRVTLTPSGNSSYDEYPRGEIQVGSSRLNNRRNKNK
jgi:hypothetical protein|tara:strand:- start:44 stop:580 length:537 start_codon:yes stop_codon:yes gene_type:complete